MLRSPSDHYCADCLVKLLFCFPHYFIVMTTSVALCTYNGSQYLRQQLESIADQSYCVDEIVICDDNSRDDTCCIIEKFIRQHPEIKVVFIKNERNVGFLKNFEKAISCCSGDIIFLSDQDDIWMPDKVISFIEYFENNEDIDVAFSNAKLINSTGTAYFLKTLFEVVGLDKKNKRLFTHGLALDLLATSGRMTGCTSAVRASFLPYIIPFKVSSVKMIHDEIMAVIAASYDKIGFIDKCLVSYRQHDNQTVGISLLFKFPPLHQESAPILRGWDKEIIDSFNRSGLEKFEFIEKRFWAQRAFGGCFYFIYCLCRRRYHRYYSYPFIAFTEDFFGFFKRRLFFLKELTKKRLSFVMKYSWNG